MIYSLYISLAFAVIFVGLTLFVRGKFTKYFAALYSVSFMLIGFAHTEYSGNFSTQLEALGYVIFAYTFVEHVKIARKFRKLQNSIYKDPLTGTYNRRFLEEMFKIEEEEYRKFKKGFCMLFIDLDNFKEVNDTFGHVKGDEVLKIIAKKIKRFLRSEDFLIRYGGDEFIVLIGGEDTELLSIVDKISEELKVNVDGIEVFASIGYACFPLDGKDLQTLIEKADKRMYRMKELMKEVRKHALAYKG